MSEKAPAKIASLTGVRAVAAACIFLWHCQGYLFVKDAFKPFYLAGAVPFFFVLSGFILTTVGMRDRSWGQFFIARIARIWPAHIAAIALLTVAFWPWSLDYFKPGQALQVLVAHALLIQAWFPNRAMWGGLNGVSWSISAEMFFYALFPFLYAAMEKRPFLMFGCVTAACVLFVTVVSLTVPSIESEWTGSISPLTGLWSFSTGVVAGTIVKGRARSWTMGAWKWSLVEALAFSLAALANLLAANLPPSEIPGLNVFYRDMGAAPAYALLIGILAISNGIASKGLSSAAFVYLGEISFSFYLVHQIVIRWYSDHKEGFAAIGWIGQFASVVVICLAISSLMFHIVEKPARTSIMRLMRRGPKCDSTPNVAA